MFLAFWSRYGVVLDHPRLRSYLSSLTPIPAQKVAALLKYGTFILCLLVTTFTKLSAHLCNISQIPDIKSAQNFSQVLSFRISLVHQRVVVKTCRFLRLKNMFAVKSFSPALECGYHGFTTYNLLPCRSARRVTCVLFCHILFVPFGII